MPNDIMYPSMEHKTTQPKLIWLEFLNLFEQFCLYHENFHIVHIEMTVL